MWQQQISRGIVFLDRDGTVIVNKHYQKDPGVTELLPNAKEGLDILRKAGFGLVMVTNQSGIARGMVREEDVKAVNQSVVDKLGGEADYFAGIYYCPHVDDDACNCRKPKPGMIEAAARDLGFSPRAHCYVVGDRSADIGLGKAVGATTILVRTGGGIEAEKKGKAIPDHIADDLLDAAEWILDREAIVIP